MSEENPAEPTFVEGNIHPEHDGVDSFPPAVYFRQARTAMLGLCILLGLGCLTSAVFFGYQFYRYLATGGAYVPTTVPWPRVLGHLLRAGGMGFICWGLTKMALSVDSKTGELKPIFAPRQRSFWQMGALVFWVLALYGVFEIAYTWRRDTYGFFRPEFESGFVTIKPNRIEFHRASELPVKGWSKWKLRNPNQELFVSPKPEITGRDIRRAMVRIAEVFPGNQAVELYIQFTDQGAKKMEDFTKSHVLNPIGVLVDGKLRAGPRVLSPISGDARLTNVFTFDEAVRMIQKGSDP